MRKNPFEDPDTRYRVLVNDHGQHSLWPSSFAVPAGWQIVHDEAARDECIKYVVSNWTDMRPKSMEAAPEV